jgi:hypothetical protein
MFSLDQSRGLVESPLESLGPEGSVFRWEGGDFRKVVDKRDKERDRASE